MIARKLKVLGWVLYACCVALSACEREASERSKTSVIVTVDSDMRDALSRVAVQVLDVKAEVVGSARSFEIADDDSWPVTFAVAPSTGKESGSFLVWARGLAGDGTQLTESKGLLTFIEGKTITAALWLLRSCRGVTCEGLQSCVGRGAQAGTCESVPVLDAEVVESGSQPPTDAGVPDVAVLVPRVQNTPTLGGFATLGGPVRSAGGLLLSDDGFELGERVCSANDFCVTASFVP